MPKKARLVVLLIAQTPLVFPVRVLTVRHRHLVLPKATMPSCSGLLGSAPLCVGTMASIPITALHVLVVVIPRLFPRATVVILQLALARRGYQSQVSSGYAASRSDAARGARSRRIDDASAEGEEHVAARRSAQRKQNESFSREIRKRFRAAKADREFDRTIGARERARARAEQQEQGSRAAVYDMRMGSTQRKSVRSMAEGESGKHGFSLPFAMPFTGSISAWATRGIVSLIAVVFAVTMLYFPCQNYYNETRQLQQLQAEYDALQEYNTQMQNQVDYLNTDEGIEDYARSELGWIRPGEHVVSVEGVTPSTDTSRSNDRVYAIPAGSVAAPDTWYSGFLDVIFGYGH